MANFVIHKLKSVACVLGSKVHNVIVRGRQRNQGMEGRRMRTYEQRWPKQQPDEGMWFTAGILSVLAVIMFTVMFFCG